ncbi:MAG: Ig-like domain-containing protein, partial [Leptonema sp. (in: Bacteria)]|nr:Ig-like domain-containing protein [Leptonema sp. (in: bacteria)]
MKQRILSYFITKKLWLVGAFSFAVIGGFLFHLFATVQIEAQSPSNFLPEPEIADSNSFDVIQTVPVGQLQTTDAKEIVVAFNQPLIPLGKVDSSDLEPFKIEPKINGKFRWYGSSVAAFLPSEPLEPGRSYSILVPAGLKDLEGRSLKQARSFSFHTDPLKLSYTTPTNGSMIEYNQTIFVKFNMAVSKEMVKPFIELTANNRPLNFSIEPANADYYFSEDESIQQAIEIRPTVALPRDAKIELSLKKGLPLLNGKPGLIADENISFNTPGPVTVELFDN